MKKLLFVFIGICSLTVSRAQNLKPCGTPSYKSEWLKNYQKNPHAYEKRSNEILYVPLAVNLVANEGGGGAMTETNLLRSLCTLNNDFADSDIQFFLGTEVRVISDGEFYTHDDVLVGAEKMFEYNVPDMINCYIVGNAGGFCGYNLPYAGVVVSQNCAMPADHTWAHEIGHNLSIQHTFLGWEGGVAHDNSISHNFANPAPELVTYDYTYFQDTLILDTLIIDTIQVEKLDGSNCAFAADGFCDTAPDYLAFRWNCDDNNLSLGQQTDPNGDKFYSDGSFIMSYAMDECSSRFSPEQSGAMRANLIDEKPTYLLNQNYQELTYDAIAFNYPISGEPVYYDKIDLSWEAIEGAEYYMVRIAFDQALTITLYERLVEGTSHEASVSAAFNQQELYWSVAPINDWNFCPDYRDFETFNTSDVSAINQVSKNAGFDVFPKVLKGNDQLTITLSETNLGGRVVFRKINGEVMGQPVPVNQPIQSISVPYAPGLYLASYYKEGKVNTKKFVIQ